VRAMMAAIDEAVDDNQGRSTKRNRLQGVLSGVFAAEVDEALERGRRRSQSKSPAPPERVRNRKARPDQGKPTSSRPVLARAEPQASPTATSPSDGRAAFRDGSGDYAES